jgi:nucleotide-binding universal stress UspA family protein
MDIKTILLPYNFTDLDKKALEFVSQTFSHVQEVEVTLFNVYTPVPSITKTDSPVMIKMQENVTYLNQLIAEQEEALNKARETLMSNGFSENRVKIVFKPKNKDIASHIIETAMNEQYNVVVINRKSSRVSRFFTGSVFNKVVSTLKGITICIIS